MLSSLRCSSRRMPATYSRQRPSSSFASLASALVSTTSSSKLCMINMKWVWASENFPSVVAVYATLSRSTRAAKLVNNSGTPVFLPLTHPPERCTPSTNDGTEGVQGNEARDPINSCMKYGFKGAKLTAPTCWLSSCIADSNEPAAMWSAAKEELLHHACLKLVPGIGGVQKSPACLIGPASILSSSSSPASSKPHPSSPEAEGSSPTFCGVPSVSMSSPHPGPSPISTGSAASPSSSAPQPATAPASASFKPNFPASSRFSMPFDTVRRGQFPCTRITGVGGNSNLAPFSGKGTCAPASSSMACVFSSKPSTARSCVVAERYLGHIKDEIAENRTKNE